MAFALVNPVTALWQRRGLTSLLMPDGYDAFAAPQQPERALSGSGPARVPSAPAHSGHPHAAQPRERHAWQQNRPQTNEAPAQQGQRQNQPSTARQQASPQNQARAQGHADMPANMPADMPAEQGKPAAWLPLPPHVWPAPWQARLAQARPGPVLWTYWNLGPDLCNPQTPGRLERRQFLQRLLQDLGHPTGTHTFWPSCLPPDPDALPMPNDIQGQNAYVANADVFWSGALQLKARGVVVMGSAAAHAVGLPGGLRPPQQLRHQGKLVWVLWDVDNLLQFDQRYTSMLALLREALRHMMR